MNPKSIWPLSLVIVAGIAAVTLMILFKADKDLVLIVSSLFLVTVPATMISAQQARTDATVQAVKDNTNGHQSELVSLVKQQGQQLGELTQLLAQSHPPVSPVPATPAAALPDPPPAGSLTLVPPLPEGPAS